MKVCALLLCIWFAGCKNDGASDEAQVRRRVAKSQELRGREGLASALAFINSAPRAKTPLGGYLMKREQASLEADLGQLIEADRHLREAIVLAKTAEKPKYAASTEITRASNLLKLNRVEEAQKCLDTAKRFGETSGDHSWDSYILKYSGRILLDSNRFESALVPLQASYEQFMKNKKPQRAAEVTVDLGWAYYRLGQLDRARALYEECERGIPSADKHLCVGHIGNVFYDLGDLKLAAASYRHAAELARNHSKDYYAGWLVNLATTLTDERQWDEAASYNSEALAIATSLKTSIALSQAMVNAGRIAAGQHNYAAAEQHLLEVENTARANPSAVLDAYAALARIYEETRKPEAAKQQFDAALKLVDGTRTKLREDENKLTYLASLMKLHRQYVAFLMKQGSKFEALQASETSRARVLRDRVNLSGSTGVSHGLADYQEAARANGAAYLVYWVTPERSFLWAIDATTFTSYVLPGEARIRHLVEQHQQTLERNPAEKEGRQDATSELFDLVVGPALKSTPGAKRFVIVPDGPLYGINFETLRKGSKYWMEDATLAVAPSLDLMLGKSAPRQDAPTALLIGDALEWTPQFPRLLSASKELAGIGHRFPETSQTLLAGAQATPAAFTKADPAKFSYIHFAAHAVPDRNSPLESAIILSQGKLSVKDVLATPVRAQLVTISACSSAGARTYSGEGLVGLAWAFLRSGAHGVVAGLWNVNDYSSPILMDALYAGLLAGKQPADALRSAKLELLHGGKYADPYYWGAFQLYLGAK